MQLGFVIIRKIGNYIAVALQDIDHLKLIWMIPKENHKIFECKTSDISSKFWPSATKLSGQAGKIDALITQLINKTSTNYKTAAFSRNILKYR